MSLGLADQINFSGLEKAERKIDKDTEMLHVSSRWALASYLQSLVDSPVPSLDPRVSNTTQIDLNTVGLSVSVPFPMIGLG